MQAKGKRFYRGAVLIPKKDRLRFQICGPDFSGET